MDEGTAPLGNGHGADDGSAPEVEGGRGRRTGRTVAIGLVALLVLAVGGLAAMARLADPVAAGVEGTELGACPDNQSCVSSRAEDPQHAIIPLVCPEATIDEVVEIATSELSGVTVGSSSGPYTHLVARSTILGLTDDLELLAFGSIIDVRSDARLGWTDRGRNRDRVDELRETLLEAGTCTA